MRVGQAVATSAWGRGTATGRIEKLLTLGEFPDLGRAGSRFKGAVASGSPQELRVTRVAWISYRAYAGEKLLFSRWRLTGAGGSGAPVAHDRDVCFESDVVARLRRNTEGPRGRIITNKMQNKQIISSFPVGQSFLLLSG